MGTDRIYRTRRYTFGEQLLTLRTRAALTQIELAEQLGVHRRSLQNWESGESYPKAESLQRLIAVFLAAGVFRPGQAAQEAAQLWELVGRDSPHALTAFDSAWFARTLALHADAAPTAATANPQLPIATPQSPTPNLQPRIVDWGEAIAIPTLYGRDSELETLRQWLVDERCRVVTIVGLGGMGKSSLAITVAQRVLAQFDVVLFRRLHNGPSLTEVLDQTIRAVASQPINIPEQLSDKIALLVRLFRARRCLLVLDNFESILQPGTLTGTYRTGYAAYGELLQALSAREHQSCLLLTSREKPAELGPLEGRSAPVRALHLSGLDESACRIILAAKDIVGTAADVSALAHLYGGNPLALQVVVEPIRELFGGQLAAFLAAGDAFFNGMGKLLKQQFARSTPLEQTILYWLAIERELVPLGVLRASIGDRVSQRELLVALESLRHRMLIERAAGQSAFTLQAVILEYVTDQLVETICQEIVDRQPQLLHSHALMQATAKNYLRCSQERLIATPLLERLSVAYSDQHTLERQLLALLADWREQPLLEQGYAPGNIINLLRMLRGNLRGLDLSQLALRNLYLQGVEMQDTSLAAALLQNSVFTETFDAILAVAVSSNGAYWAAASRRGEVRVWAAGGLTLHHIWSAHDDMVWTLAFSPDGDRLATSGSWDGTVKLWDVASGRLRWLGRHTSHVSGLAFAPDGRLLASGGSDAAIRIWDLASGQQLEILQHPAPIAGSAVAWSPAGNLVASGDVEGCIRLWELHTNRPAVCVQTIQAHTSYVDGLAFAPDGHTLASASWDGTVKLWQMPSGRLRETLSGHTDRVSRVAWSPDGRMLASSSRDQTLWLWDAGQGSYQATLQGHSAGVVGMAFTADSSELLSGSEDGTLRVWDIASRQCMRIIQGYTSSLYDVDWSPDGSQLACGGSDTLVTIYDLAAATPPRVLRGHRGVVLGVSWSGDGRYLASSEWDNAIRLWDARSGACLQLLQHPADPGNFFYGVTWSPDGQRLASGTYRHGVHVFELADHSQRWLGEQFPSFIRQAAWKPDGTQVAGGAEDGSVYVWDATTSTLLQQLVGQSSMLTNLAWSPHDTQLAAGGRGSESGQLFVWDTRTGQRVDAFAGHPGIVFALAWGQPGTLISAGSDGKLRWWNVQSGACVRECAAHQGAIQSLRTSPDRTQLASCGDDGAIMLWDLHTGAHRQTLRRDRPHERMDISGLSGITSAQRAALIALGAVER